MKLSRVALLAAVFGVAALAVLPVPEFWITQGNYIGLTVTVRATSRPQLDDLYRALSAHPMVKIVM